MPAIPRHKTVVDAESSWGGPAEVAKMAEDEKELRYCHAWVDPNGDPNAKSSYKFPHHAAGEDTPANIAGVDNALSRLPQADIPEGDRSDVEAHLNGHKEDADQKSENALRRPPIRCFEGTAAPHARFWKMRNALETGGEPEIEIYGPLSEYSWLGDEVTPKMFKDDLNRLGGGGPITLRINSPGGDVIAASVMRAIMSDYPGLITSRIDGVAASAAVLVAMSGARILIQDSAYMMIHDPSVMVFLAELDIEFLGSLLSSLKSVKAGILDVYTEKTGLTRERLTRMMSDETWMSASEAVSLGFAHEVIAGGNQPKRDVAFVNALRNYAHVPPALLQRERELADRLSVEERALHQEVQILK